MRGEGLGLAALAGCVIADPEFVQFHPTAIDIGRHQKARFFELRATTSLARLLKRQGKRDEARAMVSEIFGWFTEGFEFADLKDAKALLEELGVPGGPAEASGDDPPGATRPWTLITRVGQVAHRPLGRRMVRGVTWDACLTSRRHI